MSTVNRQILKQVITKIKWKSFSADNLLLERDYDMFSILAEVRGNIPFSFKSKGKIPLDDLSHWLVDKRTILIGKEIEDFETKGYCTLKTAKEWNKKYNCRIHQLNWKIKNWRVDSPDYHSDSWLTFQEYEQALQYYKDYMFASIPISYLSVYMAMKVFYEAEYEPRLVIWFDN